VAPVALAASPDPQKLRVGVFADAQLQPRWVAEAFARVAASEFATIALLAIMSSAGAKESPWLIRAYGKLDRLAFGQEPSEARELVLHVPHERFMTSFSECELRALDLDVVFAIGDFDDTVLDGMARYGVWRFCFGATGSERESLAGFREVVSGEPLSASGLKVRLARGAASRLAYESWSCTYPLSVARNRTQLFHKSAEFAYRALREVHRSGGGWLQKCQLIEPGSRRLAALGDCLPAVDLCRIGGRVLKRALARARYIEQWFLAFRFGDGAHRSVHPDLGGFARIMPPKDRDWADPFALETNGRYYIFFEELPYAAGKGHISVIEIGPHGRWSRPVPVLERDYHLSYPFLLEHDGSLYMIPESAQNGTVEIYRCVEFPLRWQLERVLIEGVRCVDATFHRAAERWWMFANAAPGESRVFEDELHLFHAERLLGDWKPHRRNPVKSDARCARPAGQLYRRNGRLYRPSQVCVPRYGAGLSINRVERLTPDEYAERQVQRILPAAEEGILGLHTVNCAGALTVIDAFTGRRRI
jgi:hypothetical protein